MSNAFPGVEGFAQQKTLRERISAIGKRAPAEVEFPVTVDPMLVAELMRRFPNECPEPGANASETMLRTQGAQQVIRLLARVSMDQHPQHFGGSDV